MTRLRALFSLYDSTYSVNFALELYRMGWEVICTKETHSLLIDSDVPSTTIESFTGTSKNYGIPPTLHPKVEAALAENHPENRIDLVFDIPYPLEEGADIGGITLLALAIKGGKVPVFTNEDMDKVIQELKKNGHISSKLRKSLATKANVFIIQHYIKMLRQMESSGDGWVGTSVKELLSGENPYQTPCHLFEFPDNQDPLAINKFKQLSGVTPCFTNIANLDNIIHTLSLTSEAFQKKFKKTPHLAIAAKHGNACGFGADWECKKTTILKTLFGNPTAIWGGEFVCNFPIDRDLAKLLYENDIRKKTLGDKWWMLDVLAAPAIAPEAVKILGRRDNRKLLVNKELANPKLYNSNSSIRQIRGGVLQQQPPNYVVNFEETKFNGPRFTDHDIGSLIIAWAVSWSSNLGGNEISLVKDLQMIGSGGGPATIIAVNNALTRAQEQHHSTESSIFAGDAFFPFIDVPELLFLAGCKGGLVPRGGKQEEKIQKYFKNHSMRMCYVPDQFRGFCRH